ncbi:MAG: hypothetical protein QOG91_361 [Candidatus Parcubacteria bacterium]|jgi:hypothetical protein|nr:hypothetical protein [Candidatus Parcubacteria bacterium]
MKSKIEKRGKYLKYFETDYHDFGPDICRWARACFLRKKSVKELIKMWRKKTGLKGVAILVSHGIPRTRKWFFWNENRRKLVQTWIDENDGSYVALVIAVCNPERRRITSRKSIVLHAVNNLHHPVIAENGKRIRIYVPGTGYLW